jgi:hypothetical protein
MSAIVLVAIPVFAFGVNVQKTRKMAYQGIA